MTSITQDIKNICQSCKLAQRQISNLDNDIKNKILNKISQLITQNTTKIINANQIDLANAKKNGLNQAKIDRLTLNEERINSIINSIKRSYKAR